MINFSFSSPTQLANFPPRFAKATLKKYSNPFVTFSGSDSISNLFNRSAPNRNAARILAKLPNETERPKLFVSDNGSRMCKCFGDARLAAACSFLPAWTVQRACASGLRFGPYRFNIVSYRRVPSNTPSKSSSLSLSSSLLL